MSKKKNSFVEFLKRKVEPFRSFAWGYGAGVGLVLTVMGGFIALAALTNPPTLWLGFGLLALSAGLGYGTKYCYRKAEGPSGVILGVLTPIVVFSNFGKRNGYGSLFGSDVSPIPLQQSIAQDFNGTNLSSPAAKSLITKIKAVNAKFAG